MHKRVSSSVLALAFALSLTTSSAAQTQSAGKSAHTYIPHADLETLMKSAGDHPARVVDINKSYYLGAYLLHQDAKKGTTPPPLNGWAHSDISELYYVIRGSGTWLIGGGLEGAKKDDPNGQSVKTVRGPSETGQIKGYVAQKYVAGDVMIIPVGVPHLPGYEVTETTDILRVVIDPQKALQLK